MTDSFDLLGATVIDANTDKVIVPGQVVIVNGKYGVAVRTSELENTCFDCVFRSELRCCDTIVVGFRCGVYGDRISFRSVPLITP